MKKLFTLSAILLLSALSLCINTYGQGAPQPCSAPAPGNMPVVGNNTGTSRSVMAKNSMTAAPTNYSSFTTPYKNNGTEAMIANAGYEGHPEAGMLFTGTPCENCYELIGKRTETTKTFVKEGVSGKDGGKDIMVQTSTMPMHYRDSKGNWLTIKTQLQPDANNRGIYSATEQPAPVAINTTATNKFASIGSARENIQFNHNLELIYVKPDGSEVSLGIADWTHHTAGDEGVSVKNAWPGIDIQMQVFRAAVKTNFLINHPMPEYASGKFLIRDHMHFANGLSLVATSGKQHSEGSLEIRDAAGEMKYVVSEATVYEKANARKTLNILEYYLGENNTVDIALPGSYLSKPASAYPVVIDPLVSLNTSSTVAGSSYNALWTANQGCLYMNPANTPINCTVTDIQFAFQYTATVGQLYGAFSFYSSTGTCRSPGTAGGGLSWSCNTPLAGTCTAVVGTAYSIFADFSRCLPPPSCASIPLNINMYFYQNWMTTATCVNTYVYASQPLVFTVIGHTVEIGGTGVVTATPATICLGATSSLAVSGVYGVPPYTITWTPAGGPGSPTTVTPTGTTTYTATVTDACNITATATKTVTVNQNSPVTGPTTVCVGNTITLSDATAGTWSSGTPGVATVVAATGVVSGVTTGTSTITHTTSAGACTSTYVVTVTPVPGAITGTTSICAGNSTTLGNSAAGGTWSSSNLAVATVNSSTGTVYGVSAGTTSITYSLGGSCFATTNVTVTLLDPITGITTMCVGGNTTLSDASTGGTWSSSAAGIAPVGINSGIVSGVAAGNATITYTTPTGCTTTIPVMVNLLAPITGNTTICAGSTTVLADAVPGGTWNSGTPSVATIDSAGNVGGIVADTTTITYATPLGCSATTIVTVNALPDISAVTSTNPSTCQGSDGTITLHGLGAGASYFVEYDFNGTAVGIVTISVSTIGELIILNLPSGTYSDIYVTDVATGCVSNIAGPVTLVDPLPPPPAVINSNSPICIGQTLLLSATDAVQGGTYEWTGPNGFYSTSQYNNITNTDINSSGPYTVTYTVNNCPSVSTADITIYPPLNLTNLTASQTIPYGNTIQLNADGALYYTWTPNDGSLSNPNINNPLATPIGTTTYVVIGTNLAGCKDTADVVVTIDSNAVEFVPSAFTPNGDGLNDVFKIVNMNFQKLVDFSVYNRWGQLVYRNTHDIKQGWDGTYNGAPQDMGVYNYSIIVTTAEGITRNYKGDVTLIR